jgi:hypothetical protein
MSIHVTCGDCGEEFKLKDTAAGKRFPCKVCGASIQVPAAEELADDEDEVLDEIPERPAKGPKKSPRDAIAARCFWPALFLYIVGTLSLLNHAGGIVMNLMGISTNPFASFQQPPPNETPEMARAREVGMMVGSICGAVLFIGFDAVVLYGAYCLQKLRNHSMAMTAGILSCIPICSPCLVLGIPFGIWTLVVINQPDVKAAFR